MPEADIETQRRLCNPPDADDNVRALAGLAVEALIRGDKTMLQEALYLAEELHEEYNFDQPTIEAAVNSLERALIGRFGPGATLTV